ncbi:hypothetical protein STEG23_021850 [Scotinomys teguina]
MSGPVPPAPPPGPRGRLNVTITRTSAALKVQQARAESDRLGLHAFRRLSFFLLGTEARRGEQCPGDQLKPPGKAAMTGSQKPGQSVLKWTVVSAEPTVIGIQYFTGQSWHQEFPSNQYSHCVSDMGEWEEGEDEDEEEGEDEDEEEGEDKDEEEDISKQMLEGTRKPEEEKKLLEDQNLALRYCSKILYHHAPHHDDDNGLNCKQAHD